MSCKTTPHFDFWWRAAGEWVEAPNQRRDGESGVVRLLVGERGLYRKRQAGHIHRSLRHPFGRPTPLREAESIAAFEVLGVPVPRIVFHGARKQGAAWQALLVTEELLSMMPLDRWYADVAWQVSAAARGLRLERLGETLAAMHRARWQHGCLYPKHVFVGVEDVAQVRVSLAIIDLEKCRRRCLRGLAARRDMAQFRRHRGAMPAEDWDRLEGIHAQALARDVE